MADVNREAVLKLHGSLPRKPPWPSGRCIFRVPSTIRRHNEHAYEPQLVSIGPYHHGGERLRQMEKFKRWYLGCLLDRAPNPEARLGSLFEAIASNVQYCLDCYSGELEEAISIDEFVEMMILDGCFVVELFRKRAGVVPWHPDDPIFTTAYMRKILLTDLMLLENQLPWFVLESLFDLTSSHRERGEKSVAALALDFYEFNTIRSGAINPSTIPVIKHLLDLQRNNLLSSHMSISPKHAAWYESLYSDNR